MENDSEFVCCGLYDRRESHLIKSEFWAFGVYMATGTNLWHPGQVILTLNNGNFEKIQQAGLQIFSISQSSCENGADTSCSQGS
jgi:hypothetical protein